jgi:hypothetical protein
MSYVITCLPTLLPSHVLSPALTQRRNCTAAECGNHLTLGTGSSSTFRKCGENQGATGRWGDGATGRWSTADHLPEASSQSFQVTYGSGAVAGTLCSDTVSIAGMTLDNHAFGVTTQVSFYGSVVSTIRWLCTPSTG